MSTSPSFYLAMATTLTLAACAAVPASDPAPPPPVATPAPPPASPVATANPSVGGVTMLPTRDIVANVAAAPTLSTLVAAIAAAGLEPTLAGPGPLTVFAPTDEAFGRLAPGIVDSLLKPENKASLVTLLTYHVVPGTITSADLIRRIAAGGGSATLTTVAGQPLTATMVGNVVALTDVGGNRSYIETADVRQANGIVHVVNGVVVPKLP